MRVVYADADQLANGYESKARGKCAGSVLQGETCRKRGRVSYEGRACVGTADASKCGMPFAPRNILVPTDFSGPSKSALNAALSLAAQYGATVTVLHVIEPPRHPGAPARAHATDPELDEDVGGGLREDAAVQMGAFLAGVKQRNVSSSIDAGVAYDAVVRTAETNECDLVVIGTHGCSGIQRFAMGSVAERVVRHSTCPVLTVP